VGREKEVDRKRNGTGEEEEVDWKWTAFVRTVDDSALGGGVRGWRIWAMGAAPRCLVSRQRCPVLLLLTTSLCLDFGLV
jgi:hypothetical protein